METIFLIALLDIMGIAVTFSSLGFNIGSCLITVLMTGILGTVLIVVKK